MVDTVAGRSAGRYTDAEVAVRSVASAHLRYALVDAPVELHGLSDPSGDVRNFLTSFRPAHGHMAAASDAVPFIASHYGSLKDGLPPQRSAARYTGRAREALVAQLRSNQPALFEAQITKERLALEEAIRKVEAEATRKSHNQSQAEQQAASRPRTPEVVPQVRRASEAPRLDRINSPRTDLPPRAGWTIPSARERLLSSRSSVKKRGVNDFSDVVGEVGAATAKATQTARQNREAYEPETPPNRLGRLCLNFASVRTA